MFQHKLSTIVVSLFRHPQESLRNKCFVAATEVHLRILRGIELGLGYFISVSQKPYPFIL